MVVLPMKKIALLNLKGGCGATTIAANLADVLSISNKTWLWQTDDLDQLSMHFGQSVDTNVDWKSHMEQSAFQSMLENCWFDERLFTFFSTARTAQSNIGNFEYNQQIKVLLNSLSHLVDPHNESYSVIHLPTQFHRIVNLDELSSLVDLIIVVGTADAQTYQRLNIFVNSGDDSFFNQNNVKLLINRYNPELGIENDMCAVIKDDFSDKVLPEPIFNSPEFLESAANLLTLKAYANDSFAYKDVCSLASWCKEWLQVNSTNE